MIRIDPNKATYPDLNDRTVLISGGATGIGEALVKAFARQGARTGFVDIAADAGEKLADDLNSDGCTVAYRACDVTDTRNYQLTIQKFANELGPVTILVNNAANDTRHQLEDITPERFDELIGANIKHAMFAAQTVAPMMREAGGGSMINLGSIGWMTATAGYPIYAASKAGIHGMTRALARDLGGDGIRVNTLVPGWVMTERQLQNLVDDEAREVIKQSQCLPGQVLPQHIAQMALFLASDASSMCSAQKFIVDGGWA